MEHEVTRSRKAVGLVLIVAGTAGLVVPVMPGWLLIAAGAAMRRRPNR